MDALSLGKAGGALNKIKDMETNIIAPLAEGRFPTVDARLDWLSQQADKIKVTSSKQVDLTQGTFINTEVSAGKIRLKVIGSTPSDTYATSGTWESPAINLSDGWQLTSAIEVLKSNISAGIDATLEIASSVDSTTFSAYAPLDLQNLPQQKYIKLRATLVTSASAATPINLDFNQSDPQNMFTLDSYSTADGRLQLKTSYSDAMTNEGAVGTGTILSTILDKSAFKSIEKVSVS